MNNFRRKYRIKKSKDRICCNMCGRVIAENREFPKVDFVEINKNWGYFSNKDNENHNIHICESCYDQWVKSFSILPSVKNNSVCI
ncbi:hypothetical protein EDC18_1088 [Natranaerovirga pectinivora]|uniref:Uncharacterized protein n=1 Tax=Natranaerovirga pectinivora TaxID=682400 RepID=A0A4R3MIL2_9FIRM|nr:hypothetical protein [Natranaerovirga pectinivora]TCT13774.1 hypothetical protein EDC18_1088 [Natranaerovirga pectinivora]